MFSVLLPFALVGVVLCLLWLFFRPPFGTNIVRLNTAERRVALTFDDGPNPPSTERLLDVLAKHGVQATFFLIGNRMERHPETVARVIAEGHQIGNHSYSHPLLGFLPPGVVRREIQRTDALIRTFGVTGEILFRAPVLTRFLPVAHVLKKENRPHISCNVWSWDWTTQDPEKIAATVVRKAVPGGIIVLHDGKAENSAADRSGTVIATDLIITALKREGYRFVCLDEMRGWHTEECQR